MTPTSAPRAAWRRRFRAPSTLLAAASFTAALSAAPAQVCTPPIAAAATSGAFVVGNGTAASCTGAALQAAVTAYPLVTFDCGSAAATIAVPTTIVVPVNRNTVIDGGGKVTLDAGGHGRIFVLNNPNFRTNAYGLTLQHIALVNGQGKGTTYVPPSASNASCAYGWADGGGGAIYVRDAVLHAIDVTFRNNHSATPGPDVAGGAIYAVASLDVTLVGSTFDTNAGANGGAVGLLQSDGRLVNDLFSGNQANGTGANYVGGAAQGCAGVAQANQGGAGGNGGAVSIDGAADTAQTVCGSTFTGGSANEYGGALFRTVDGTAQTTTIDRSLFRSNQANKGGALYIQNSKPLVITASTFAGNTAVGAGGAYLYGDRLQMTNATWTANVATKGVGGAIVLSSPDAAGWIRNVTFSGNQSSGGSGYFSAAIFGTPNFPVDNTVFANNTTADAGSPMQCGFTPATGTADVQWPQKRVTGGLNDNLCVNAIRFVDPLLGALAANGGPTPTIAPAAASPLRKTGTACPATDQRGVARNTAQCTIGAVE